MNKKKYIIYARSATQDDANENTNIDYQISELIRFAQKSDIEIIGVISEYGSGLSCYRSGLIKLLDRLNHKEAQGILCTRWDRLTRNSTTAFKLSESFRQHDIDVLTLQPKIQLIENILNKIRVSNSKSSYRKSQS